jgi:alkanesulfonate monooxygenase SsuD/methylene tetrahydromethanopterin reductase-like flavin-dependent oxidoreductase (luciferase family)
MLRFSMRAPMDSDAGDRSALYAATIDMCEWAEARGAIAGVFSQHHSSDDGYLPSPIPLAAAVAARTSTLPINVAALLLLHYEPVKLAEDLAVVDLISQGRVSYVLGLGYREVEFEMFGVDRRTRGALVEERILQLRALWAGETVEIDGRKARVTPAPFTPGGPLMMAGGGSIGAAKRAARLGMMFLTESSDPALAEVYNAEAARCGIAPAGIVQPDADPSAALTLFVADDPDAAWAEIGEYLLADAASYAGWNATRSGIASLSYADSVEELKAERASYQIVTPDEARKLIAAGQPLALQPLAGGIPPEVAWPYLEAAAAVSS